MYRIFFEALSDQELIDAVLQGISGGDLSRHGVQSELRRMLISRTGEPLAKSTVNGWVRGSATLTWYWREELSAILVRLSDIKRTKSSLHTSGGNTLSNLTKGELETYKTIRKDFPVAGMFRPLKELAEEYMEELTLKLLAEGKLRIAEESAPFNDEDAQQLPLWERDEWRNRRRLSKCGKQLLKMFYRTGCRGKTWEFIETALNEAEDWSEDDWKDLHDEGWDMAVEGAERLRKAEGEG